MKFVARGRKSSPMQGKGPVGCAAYCQYVSKDGVYLTHPDSVSNLTWRAAGVPAKNRNPRRQVEPLRRAFLASEQEECPRQFVRDSSILKCKTGNRLCPEWHYRVPHKESGRLPRDGMKRHRQRGGFDVGQWNRLRLVRLDCLMKL